MPKFLTDPYSVLPEDIDISKFGQRVKELGLRVYRANPYISIAPDKSSSGWFDFDSGGIVDPIMYGDDFDQDEQKTIKQNDSNRLNIEELKELTKKQRNKEKITFIITVGGSILILIKPKNLLMPGNGIRVNEKVNLSRLPMF